MQSIINKYYPIIIIISILIILIIFFIPIKKFSREKYLEWKIRKIEGETNSKIIFIVDKICNNGVDCMTSFLRNRIVNINNINQFLDSIRDLYLIKKNIKIIMHTFGGYVSSSDFIVNILLKFPKKVEIYIPYFSFSAGTLISLTGDVIYMSKYAQTGPTDPQVILDKDNDRTSGKILIDLMKEKDKNELKDSILIKSLESKVFRKDNLETLKRIFKKKKINSSNQKKLLNLLASGKYPHQKPIDGEKLKSFGLNVKLTIPPEIDDIFQIYLKVRKEAKRMT